MPRVPTPTPALLQGSWTGAYAAFTLLVSPPISPPARTNPIPKVGGDYTPSAAIITILFDGQGSHSGKILINFAGTLTITRIFSGTYEVTTDQSLGIVEGDIHLQLPTDQLGSSQVSILHFVMRSHEEMVFVLKEAHVPFGPPPPLTTAGGGVAHGTLKRVVPMEDS